MSIKRRIKKLAAFLIPSLLSLAGEMSFAAEFEVLDRFSVDGYSVLKGSADIPGGSFAVGGSTLVVKNGNIGIGVTAPAVKLDVNDTNIGGLATMRITTPSGNQVVISTSGQVGIGTINPAANLDIAGGIRLGNVADCALANAGTVRWTGLHFEGCTGSVWRQLDNQPPPIITSIIPAAGLTTGGTAITIYGSGFNLGLEVLIGGAPATVSGTTGTQIAAATPAGSAGAKDVTVTTPDGQYYTAGAAFTYNVLPVITIVSPNSGLKATAVTITGTGFAAGAAVTIGDTDAAGVWVSATQITATAPSNSFINAKDVKVTNPDTGSVTLTNGFTYFTGTGGTITTYTGYRVHTFTSGGTFTVNAGGNVDVLVVAGGGGGANNHGGGGGAGGMIYNSAYSVNMGQAVTVTVGDGGPGGSASAGAAGTIGSNSVFATLTAIGGGGGGGRITSDVVTQATSGGSGGGGAGTRYGTNPAPSGGSGTSNQGYNGGAGYSGATAGNGGGGGGAGAVGQSASTDSTGAGTGKAGDGGSGVANSIRGTSVYYAGGGSGGRWASGTGSTPGLGGGGQGGNSDGAVGGAGTTNTGGGGGGGGGGVANGGAGGSGIVIIRYPN